MLSAQIIPDLTDEQIEFVRAYLIRQHDHKPCLDYLNRIYRAIKPEQIYHAIHAAYPQIARDHLSDQAYRESKSIISHRIRQLLLHYHEAQMKPVRIAATVFTIVSCILIVPLFLRTYGFFYNVFSAIPNNRFFSTFKKNSIVEPSFKAREILGRLGAIDTTFTFGKEDKGQELENTFFSNKRKNVRKIKFNDGGYFTFFGTRAQIAHAREKAALKMKYATDQGYGMTTAAYSIETRQIISL